MKLYPNVATDPETIMTTIFIIFLKSFTNKAIKVKGTAKLNPNSSGIADPKTMPKNVVICQITPQVNPPPIRWKCLFLSSFFLKN